MQSGSAGAPRPPRRCSCYISNVLVIVIGPERLAMRAEVLVIPLHPSSPAFQADVEWTWRNPRLDLQRLDFQALHQHGCRNWRAHSANPSRSACSRVPASAVLRHFNSNFSLIADITSACAVCNTIHRSGACLLHVWWRRFKLQHRTRCTTICAHSLCLSAPFLPFSGLPMSLDCRIPIVPDHRGNLLPLASVPHQTPLACLGRC